MIKEEEESAVTSSNKDNLDTFVANHRYNNNSSKKVDARDLKCTINFSGRGKEEHRP